ncbi:MAG TPA: LuxR C-terminal-related transcriptional regulator [Gemmatimonadaceae bacterium]|nr:LuxR C-terminal-related transcriptional regulator [Gemmatimonadaceae bacterium]
MKREAKVDAAVQRGRDAIERHAWGEAYTHLAAADAATALGAGDLERLASAAYLIGKDEIADELWVRAHNEHVRSHDSARAARCAFWLVLDLFTRGEIARASGWLTRGQRLLDETHTDCAERGLLLVMVARVMIERGDFQSAAAAAHETFEMARRFDDRDLDVFARLVLAQTLARTGRIGEATALFDEMMVAITVDDVSPISVGIVYCAVIGACHQIADVGRARAWTSALSRWCEAQPDLVPFRGKCLVHRVEIMRLSGAWSKAVDEAERACTWLSQAAARLDAATREGDLPSFKYPVGAAWYELAEIHRMRGDFTKAADAYERASRHGHSPEPGLALLRLAQGRSKIAEAAARRLLGQSQSRIRRANTLAACVEIMIAVGDLRAARSAAKELGAIAAESSAPLLHACAAQWIGAILRAEGDARAALGQLRAAWSAWQEIDAPYEAARVRVLMGLACRDLHDEDAAALELDAARRVFQRLAAAPDVARVSKLMGDAGSAGGAALTARETEVIGLVATGKTNRAIAQQLSISERTVDRHVSNILLKLELPSRSAATAYAYERGLV